MDYPSGGEGVRALQNAQQEETILGIKTYKLFWSIFFGIVFIIIFLVVYLIFTSGHKNVSDKKLMEGVAMEVGQNDVINFELDKEEHGMWINFVGGDSVELTISSDPINVSLKINEIKEIDVNNDGTFDLKIKLVGIVNGKATIAFQKIEAQSCKENWKCTEWFSCFKGIQRRECEDLNSCGSIFDRPSLKKECLEIEFVQNNSAFKDNVDNNQSVNDTVNSINSTLHLNNNTGIAVISNNSANKSDEYKINTSASHTSSTNNASDELTWTNSTSPNYSVNNTTTNSAAEISYSEENYSTSSATSTSQCASDTFMCYEYYGYFCGVYSSSNPISKYCCSQECSKFTSKEQLCYARGYSYFTGNDTHICNVQVYSPFNGSNVLCCASVQSRFVMSTNSTEAGGLSNQI